MTETVDDVLSRRRGYRHLSSLPAFHLLDTDHNLVASVRAQDADEARTIFKLFGLSGEWLRTAS
jgi:hypothetical protein